MARIDIRRWALKGAEQRLVEIAAEARGIFARFPELREQGRGFESEHTRATVLPHVPRTPKRRSKISPEARQRIAEAQRKRWAKWRAKSGRTGTGAGASAQAAAATTPPTTRARKKR